MRLKLLLTILFTLVLTISASFQTYTQQIEKPKEKECSLNFWDFTYTPMSFLGLVDAPAKIISTSSGGRTGVMLTGVDLKNLSGKTITAVKFQWFLYRADKINEILTPRKNPNIITQGETSSVKIDECQPEEECSVDYSIVWCKDVYEAFLQDNSKGEPVIEATVSEILYSDGSAWKRK